MTSVRPTRPGAFKEAYDAFIKSIRPDDATFFQGLTLEDIESTALEIQDSQRKKRSLRNLRKIAPLFEAFRKYAKVIDVLCNQTPYLPFVWVSTTGLLSWLILLIRRVGTYRTHAQGERVSIHHSCSGYNSLTMTRLF